MRCPQCGKESPDDARYCSNCLANLELMRKDHQMPEDGFVYRVTETPMTLGEQAQQQPLPPQPTASAQPAYHSVSEWREVAARQPIRPPAGRRRGIGGVKLDWAIYGGITLALTIAVVLMVTLWGNPMPEKVAREFMEALNRKDVTAMRGYVYSGGNIEMKLSEMTGRIGEGGGFSGLKFEVEESNAYEAVVSITDGTYNPGGSGFSVEITPEKRLMLKMESHEGHWYVDLSASRIFP